jgi:dipeptidyl aminopeptidase/acylaminoacyl peptidase
LLRRLLPLVAILVGLSAAAPASAVVLGANGKILYTLQAPGNYDIWAIQPDGSGNVPLVTAVGNDQGGSWSPDGTRFVFRSDRTGGGDIYVANADGTNQVRLTSDPAQESHPSFSPDGTRIVFTRKDPDDEIFVMNADGSGAVRRTDNTVTDAGPEFSPDGTRIVYFSGNNVIHVMNADGSNPHPLDPGNFSVGPQWSPDAAHVLFQRSDAGASHPFVINPDGTGLAQVGQGIPPVQAPSWSPDGGKIVFLTGTGGSSDIWIMNSDGTGGAPIVDDALVRSGPKWQPIPRAPTALTQAPSNVTPLSAQLNGTIDSNVLNPTTYFFEYGTTTAYGSRTPDTAAPAPVGLQAVSANLDNLRTSVTYHARLVARNGIGTTTGADQTFRTSRARPTSLSSRATPRRDRRLPFRYVVGGRLGRPAVVPAAEACRGRVSIKLKKGRRTVVSRSARLSKSCRYRKVVAIKSTRRLRAARGRLKVTVSFPGNGVLTSRRAKARVVRFG